MRHFKWIFTARKKNMVMLVDLAEKPTDFTRRGARFDVHVQEGQTGFINVISCFSLSL